MSLNSEVTSFDQSNIGLKAQGDLLFLNKRSENMGSFLYYSREEDVIELWTYQFSLFSRHDYWCQKVTSLDTDIIIYPPIQTRLRDKIDCQKEKLDRNSLKIIWKLSEPDDNEMNLLEIIGFLLKKLLLLKLNAKSWLFNSSVSTFSLKSDIEVFCTHHSNFYGQYVYDLLSQLPPTNQQGVQGCIPLLGAMIGETITISVRRLFFNQCFEPPAHHSSLDCPIFRSSEKSFRYFTSLGISLSDAKLVATSELNGEEILIPSGSTIIYGSFQGPEVFICFVPNNESKGITSDDEPQNMRIYFGFRWVELKPPKLIGRGGSLSPDDTVLLCIAAAMMGNILQSVLNKQNSDVNIEERIFPKILQSTSEWIKYQLENGLCSNKKIRGMAQSYLTRSTSNRDHIWKSLNDMMLCFAPFTILDTKLDNFLYNVTAIYACAHASYQEGDLQLTTPIKEPKNQKLVMDSNYPFKLLFGWKNECEVSASFVHNILSTFYSHPPNACTFLPSIGSLEVNVLNDLLFDLTEKLERKELKIVAAFLKSIFQRINTLLAQLLVSQSVALGQFITMDDVASLQIGARTFCVNIQNSFTSVKARIFDAIRHDAPPAKMTKDTCWKLLDNIICMCIVTRLSTPMLTMACVDSIGKLVAFDKIKMNLLDGNLEKGEPCRLLIPPVVSGGQLSGGHDFVVSGEASQVLLKAIVIAE